MKGMVGVLHSCKKDNGLTFLNPRLFPTCPKCGEDMTNKPLTQYEVTHHAKP